MDKTEFLILIQMARKNAATQHNITSAWEKSGLFPTNPQIILDKLGLLAPGPHKSPSIAPPGTIITASNGDSIAVPFTPANAKQVDQLIQQIKEGNCDPMIAQKLAKACSSAFANALVLKSINNDLRLADQRKKNKSKRRKGHWGQGQIMNLETVQQRKNELAIQQLDKEIRTIMHLSPAIFGVSMDDKSPVKKKPAVPSTPGPLAPILLLPSQASVIDPSQQKQRGKRGGKSRKQVDIVVPQVEEEEEEEEKEEEKEETVKKSRSGRILKAKTPYINPHLGILK